MITFRWQLIWFPLSYFLLLIYDRYLFRLPSLSASPKHFCSVIHTNIHTNIHTKMYSEAPFALLQNLSSSDGYFFNCSNCRWSSIQRNPAWNCPSSASAAFDCSFLRFSKNINKFTQKIFWMQSLLTSILD